MIRYDKMTHIGFCRNVWMIEADKILPDDNHIVIHPGRVLKVGLPEFFECIRRVLPANQMNQRNFQANLSLKNNLNRERMRLYPMKPEVARKSGRQASHATIFGGILLPPIQESNSTGEQLMRRIRK